MSTGAKLKRTFADSSARGSSTRTTSSSLICPYHASQSTFFPPSIARGGANTRHRAVDQWLADGPTVVPPGPISILPPELIHTIFDELHELDEIIYLAITCKLLLSIGKPHILRATKAHYAPWAGCRLITIDDEAQPLADLPLGLLTDAERKEIEATGNDLEHADPLGHRCTK